MKYVCELCGTIYEEEAGDVKHGVPAGTAFENLPQYYGCPVCGSEKEAFCKVSQKSKAATAQGADRAFWLNAKYSDGCQESQR